MSDDQDIKRYYIRATNPANNDQVAFECPSLAIANAKAAELRMSGYKDVVMSVKHATENSGADK